MGLRLAELLVALFDDPHRFGSGRQVGSYLGLVPRQFQSGAMDRHGRITRHGNPLARALLVEVAWLGLRWNGRLRAIYERVHRGSRARRKVAIVAVARRLAVFAWAMLRDGVTEAWASGGQIREGGCRAEGVPGPAACRGQPVADDCQVLSRWSPSPRSVTGMVRPPMESRPAKPSFLGLPGAKTTLECRATTVSSPLNL